MRRFQQEVEAVKVIYNSAWTHNWGFVPMTEAETWSMAKKLKPLIESELMIMAEVDGKPAAFFLALPDYNQVLGKINGRLGPVAFLKFLWYSRKISDIRCGMGVGGVSEKDRGPALSQSFKAAVKKARAGGFSWILGDNVLMQRDL
jgi:hypothetical protein